MRALETFQSGGKTIKVETFFPKDAESAPSIIVLHGATGIETANRFIALLAQGIASQGFVTHLVHYFDRTGTQYADDETMRLSAQEWIGTVDDAVKFIRRLRPKASIGCLGTRWVDIWLPPKACVVKVYPRQ